MDIQKIIVGTDFSDHSATALRHALTLARRTGAEVEIVHVIGTYPAGDVPVNYGEILREHKIWVRARMEDLHQRNSGQGVTLSKRVIEGRIKSSLLRLVEEAGAQLVVVGSHGYTGWKRFFLGSVAEAIVRRSPTDVLVVRPAKREGSYDRILVPTDFSEGAELALQRAIALGAEGAEIDLLHCWMMPTPVETYSLAGAAHSELAAAIELGASERARSLLERYGRPGIELSFSAIQSPARAGIAERAAGYDLVVVGSNSSRVLNRFLGGVAGATVRHASCSVYVARV